MLKYLSGKEVGDAPWGERVWRFRHRHFVERFGWEALRKTDGCERDAFDRDDAIHLVLTKDNVVVGYSRLLPTTKPHLLSHVYPEIAAGNAYPTGQSVYEWTRCVAEPGVTIDGVQASNILLTGVLEFSLVTGIEALIVETHPKLVNLLVSTGWDVMPFAAPSMHLESLVVPICAKPLRSALHINHELYAIQASVIDLGDMQSSPVDGEPLRRIFPFNDDADSRTTKYA